MAETEKNYLSEMISDVEYVIEWLETGRRPESKRGIERRAAYQREKLIDPIRMQAFVFRGTAGSPCNLTEWEKEQLEDALSFKPIPCRIGFSCHAKATYK